VAVVAHPVAVVGHSVAVVDLQEVMKALLVETAGLLVETVGMMRTPLTLMLRLHSLLHTFARPPIQMRFWQPLPRPITQMSSTMAGLVCRFPSVARCVPLSRAVTLLVCAVTRLRLCVRSSSRITDLLTRCPTCRISSTS
jgi:hypothetical protein